MEKYVAKYNTDYHSWNIHADDIVSEPFVTLTFEAGVMLNLPINNDASVSRSDVQGLLGVTDMEMDTMIKNAEAINA